MKKRDTIHSVIPSPDIKNYQLFHWLMYRIIGRKTNCFFRYFLEDRNQKYSSIKVTAKVTINR